MKILHLETSSKNCSVAVSDGEKLLCLCEEAGENYKQSESLHTFVQFALEGARITLADLDAVSLGMGPGSYTGLRIGAAAAKGFCFALNLPLIVTDSLESMVEPYLQSGYDFIIPMLDARRMEVYTAVFDGKTGARLVETQAHILTDSSFTEYQQKKVIIIGDGASKAADILALNNADYRPDVFPSAEYLVKPAAAKFRAKEFVDVAYFEPLYLKEFQGVKKKPAE